MNPGARKTTGVTESETKFFNTGARLFKEGGAGDVAYLIKSGKVKITKTGGDGQQKVIGLVGSGGIIGEMALIDDQARVATVEAMEDTTVLVISQDALKARLDKTDPVVGRLLNSFTERVREQSRLIAKLQS